ncbi:ArpU family phage packaging/lysis transcriptional regulator [Listeria ivanovii]|uniref:ArpU family phage packaging/lysis transcriptional regulator n=1 Tax=Listeria ivanovii TaxID=1638 RepID=UPI001942FC31|nr:ArpU family phage packaging/lysis transcriptional regulator [Listeria ivanovii]MBM5707683.1 hypothetical protein [Listeria ivanovii]
MLSLLPQINVEKTIENAKQVLECYRSLERIAGTDYSQKLTASYSLEPKGGGTEQSPIEGMIVRRLDATNKSYDIYAAVARLNTTSQKIIKYTFMYPEQYSERQVQDVVQKYGGNFRELKKKALLMFAEAYNQGELLVY